MSDVKELKRISLEFRRLASNLLGTGYETADIVYTDLKNI